MVRLIAFFTIFLPLGFGDMLTGCSPENADAERLAVSVIYTEVKAGPVTLTTELPGRVSAIAVSEVRPQVRGIILERLFEEGAEVKKGDVLYRIEPSLYQAAVNNSKATLAKAEANVNAAKNLVQRYAQLTKVNAISQQDYDDACAAYGQTLAKVEEARAALETAQINLDFTLVRSPIAGHIGRSFVTPGALVTMNQPEPLTTVRNLETVYVDVTQSNTALRRLKRAYEDGFMQHGASSMHALLKYDDGTLYTRREFARNSSTGMSGGTEYEDVPVTGQIKFSESAVSQTTGTVTLRMIFPNYGSSLLPGMYVHVVIEEGKLENAILVPQKAVSRDNRGRHFVRVLVQNGQEGKFTVSSRAVRLDRPVGNSWLIAEGLESGELLMLEGAMKLRHGEPVSGVLETAQVQADLVPQM